MNRRARQWGIIAALLLACGFARAVEPTLVADTHVNAALPNTNSGTVSNIAVGGGYTGLFQFDLATLPAGTTAAQVSRATLRLYVNRVDTAGVVTVSPLNAAWSEYGVTYSTLPSTGATIGTIAVSQVGSFVTLDVTAIVQSWLTTPAGNHGLAFTAATAAVQFDSKENDLTAHPATLDVTLSSQGATGATGATGAAGPAGPQGAQGIQGLAGSAGSTGPQGISGPAGAPGAAGAIGASGAVGLTGLSGPAGPAGATGSQGIKGLPGVGIEGPYASSTNYGLNDVVTWQGSSWYSLTASNHGNTPDQSPTFWAVLAAAGVGTTGASGATGATGPQGLTGPQGSLGLTGPQGPTGIQGPRGLPGLVYQGAYASSTNYALGDVVLWQGASWASLVDGNHGNTPNFSPSYWGVLTQQGPTGATGATGVAGPVGATGALGPVGPPGERGDQGLQGIAGQAGAQGIPGATGVQGLSGPAGPQGVAGPVGIAFQGSYNSATNYALADGVIYNGAGYVSLIAGNHGNTPDQSPAAWSLFAAGTPGATGPAGAAGATGATGPQGQQGFLGAAGPQGPVGPQGPATVTYTGNYSSTTNYNLNDAAAYAGSTYVSMVAGNHGNTPDQSPAYWTVLVAKGDSGAQGVAGAPGAAGAAGVAGPAGVAGAQGPPVTFAGGWSASHPYSLGDAVSYAGSSYIALAANTGREPDVSPLSWGILAAVGSVGPAGATGATGLQGPTGYAGPTGATGPAGPTGSQGPAGATGSAGPAGPTGAAGPQGAAGVAGIAYRGAYSSGRNYGLNDGVVFSGATYISLAANNSGNTPDASPVFWGLLAAQGAQGAAGQAGSNGTDGATGATGAAGPQGPQGLAGAAGANGAAGLVYQGTWSSAANYALNDAVTYNGSSFLSLAVGNHGNAPDTSPASWAVLAQMGSAGAQGATGAAGPAGVAGAAGATGPQGAQGASGAAGINFRGAWVTGSGYAANDAVTYAGATYLAQVANASVAPDSNAGVWAVLAAAGSAGPTGAAGVAATVAVGTVTSGAAGSSPSVTNSGTASAAVLNFTIPQGATGASGTGGTGGGAGTSGIPYAAMYHSVSYAATYYSVNNTNQSANETASVLTWVPGGCSATRLDVFSQQGGTITVTLRVGSPGAMADSALSCQVSTANRCSMTGTVAVATGQFVDIGIRYSDSNPAGVWTAVSCN